MMENGGIFDGARVPRSSVLEAELQAPWCCIVEASDDTYLYVVRSGSCVLETADLDAPLTLQAGDIVTLVAGQRHVWRDAIDTPARPTVTGFDQAAALGRPAPGRAIPGRTMNKAAVDRPADPSLTAGPQARGNRAGRTRLLILSAPRDSNRFVSVYPALVAIPRTARESHAFLQRVVRLIEMENVSTRPGRDSVMRRLAELVVIELVRFALPRMPRGGRNWLGGLNDPHIGRAISLMHSKLGEAWTLSGLSVAVGMSRAVFVERFTRLVGEPPNRYLRRVRMHYAATQLDESDEPIVRIAEAVGYCSESAFNKAFSKEMGIAPARYRRLHRTR